MKKQKMSFRLMQGALNRSEMQKIVAGVRESGGGGTTCKSCTVSGVKYQCTYNESKHQCWCDADNLGCGNG